MGGGSLTVCYVLFELAPFLLHTPPVVNVWVTLQVAALGGVGGRAVWGDDECDQSDIGKTLITT